MQFLNILNERLVGIWRQCPPVILSKVDVCIEGNGKNSRCALQEQGIRLFNLLPMDNDQIL